MTRIFLVIKGDRDTAYAESVARGIGLVIDTTSSIWNETYAYAPISAKAKIIEWYARGAGTTEPAQLGDCLWYSERND